MMPFGSRIRPTRPAGDALVVEADRATRELLGAGLSEIEWRPHLAFNLGEALEPMHLYEPHVVLLDAQTTPREFELLTVNLQLELGLLPPNPGRGRPRGDQSESALVGAYDYLGIPFAAEELGLLVEHCRALYERGRHLRRFAEAALATSQIRIAIRGRGTTEIADVPTTQVGRSLYDAQTIRQGPGGALAN